MDRLLGYNVGGRNIEHKNTAALESTGRRNAAAISPLLGEGHDRRVVFGRTRTRVSIRHRREHDLIDRHTVLTNLHADAADATRRESHGDAVPVPRAPPIVFPAP